MLLVLDHKDSFTGNLVHLLHRFGDVRVIQYPAPTSSLTSDLNALILSPGPGQPKDYPETLKLYEKAKKLGIPILGVCLGFQMILYAEGAKIVRQPKVLHGVQTDINCDTDCRTYQGMDNIQKVGRYHSLQIEHRSIPAHVHITAWDNGKTIPLSLELNEPSKIFGMQYHPESFLTPEGEIILKNVLERNSSVVSE